MQEIVKTDKSFAVYNDGVRMYQLKNGDVVPDGLVRGALPQKKETVEKRRQAWLSKTDEERAEINRKRSESVKIADANKDPEVKAMEYQKRRETMNSKSEEEKAIYRKKLSDSSIGKNKGKIPWSKGLTKETHPSLARAAEKNSEHMKAFWSERTHEDAMAWRDGMREKMHENGTEKTSKPEEDLYKRLCLEYGEEDIIRRYKDDDRYPFECDFYIKSTDTFIELNRHPSHGTHPFDPNNEEDIKLIEELKTINTPWSNMIVSVWSGRDYKKRMIAEANNLNYIQLY